MPCAYWIDVHHNLVISVVAGDITVRDLSTHFEQLGTDPCFSPDFYHLLDARRVTGFQATAVEVRSLAEDGMFPPATRRAFVVNRALDNGFFRLFGAYRFMMGEREIEVFAHLEDAFEWLELPALGLPPLDRLGTRRRCEGASDVIARLCTIV